MIDKNAAAGTKKMFPSFAVITVFCRITLQRFSAFHTERIFDEYKLLPASGADTQMAVLRENRENMVTYGTPRRKNKIKYSAYQEDSFRPLHAIRVEWLL